MAYRVFGAIAHLVSPLTNRRRCRSDGEGHLRWKWAGRTTVYASDPEGEMVVPHAHILKYPWPLKWLGGTWGGDESLDDIRLYVHVMKTRCDHRFLNVVTRSPSPPTSPLPYIASASPGLVATERRYEASRRVICAMLRPTSDADKIVDVLHLMDSVVVLSDGVLTGDVVAIWATLDGGVKRMVDRRRVQDLVIVYGNLNDMALTMDALFPVAHSCF